MRKVFLTKATTSWILFGHERASNNKLETLLNVKSFKQSRYRFFPLQSIVSFIANDEEMGIRLDEVIEKHRYFKFLRCSHCGRNFLSSATKVKYILCPYCDTNINKLEAREVKIGSCIIKETKPGEPTRCEECLECCKNNPEKYDKCLTYCAVRNWKGWKLVRRSA